MNTPTYPYIFKNEIIHPNSKKIIDCIKEHENSFGSLSESNYWEGRTLHLPELKDQEVVQLIKDHGRYMLEKFQKYLNNGKSVFLDSLHIVRWTEGYELHPHADAEEPDGSDHPFPWRTFGTVTFLNDDFDGGVLYYPNKDGLQIPARTGYTAIHTGGVDCLHGVTKMTNGTRYTLASFITYDEKHSIRL